MMKVSLDDRITGECSVDGNLGQVDLVHLLDTREQELRAIAAEV